MMSQKHLQELLEEDQEPFHLNEFLADKRNQLKRPSPIRNSLQVKKRNPMYESSCLFSFHFSKDIRKSPNRVFLHIPDRTSALLLEAAHRIQKQSCSINSKTQNKNHGFGLLGSILKRLNPKHRTQKKDIMRWDSSVGPGKLSNGRNSTDEKTMVSCSCHDRASSVVWSDCNEEKSSDMETSTCSSLSEIDFVSEHRKVEEFRSPTISPIRHRKENKGESSGAEGLMKMMKKEEDDEENEQFSPVSVLDTPFEEGNKYECSIVQSMFLSSEPDPVDQLEEEEDDETLYEDTNLNSFSQGPSFLAIRSIPSDMKRLVSDLINEEENEVDDASSDMEEVIERVCKKIEVWNDVDSTTIDMMLEQDWSSNMNIWKNLVDQKMEVAKEVEICILRFLMDELTQELEWN